MPYRNSISEPDKRQQIVRWLPESISVTEDEFWHNSLSHVKDEIEDAIQQQEIVGPRAIEIEFCPKEITEEGGET